MSKKPRKPHRWWHWFFMSWRGSKLNTNFPDRPFTTEWEHHMKCRICGHEEIKREVY